APWSVVTGTGGVVYIADTANNRVRQVDGSGTITNVAGSADATAGNSGDGGAATSATLNSPRSVAADANGDVYIGDWGNNRVREVLAAAPVPVIRPLPTVIV